jgi:hypothetical protein
MLMSGLTFSLLASVLLGSQKIEDVRRNYSPLDPETNAAILVEKRIELELRRVGGPRREAVKDLLRSKFENNDRAWTREVLEACQARLVDCNDYLSLASKKVEGLRGKELELAEYDRSLISREAVLQRMMVRERHAFYERAISNISATVDDVKV